ncbi:DUF397 domain-containing protein [Streptomyces sp. HNM0645]|uniref:DUF397 domain-containing protein n=1 Tax=Streptomyces sp. HNM0645 TaxID=2782343 RepID=UPI0024B7E217|nr:DUF397 domain-containing protein [Streptomyces sp. HNM0645]MDI9884602.1 DUF397 domain-containing protein [Streptomyces sp. HNM0645]
MTEHSTPVASAPTGWRRSTFSGPEADSCVEVLDAHPSHVPVRDSKRPHGPALAFPRGSWGAFTAAVKDGTPP